ncbi:CcmD family protein [Selenihalanaerobacter shriftii]|uniref:CcmD family protein n=1 Tax=Selenihalanaerobacter shriftii TaxID=142842 RepID=A0A1T4PNR0_9FIRM|nr:CcmD family protein [Selenihalanaerobacter shriftii]SJZ93173.1 CcmD family protein [Selenihalanaerobacter shriftii]
MDKLNYLFAGYLIIWIIIFGYTMLIGRKQKNLEEEVEFMKKNIEKMN